MAKSKQNNAGKGDELYVPSALRLRPPGFFHALLTSQQISSGVESKQTHMGWDFKIPYLISASKSIIIIIVRHYVFLLNLLSSRQDDSI